VDERFTERKSDQIDGICSAGSEHYLFPGGSVQKIFYGITGRLVFLGRICGKLMDRSMYIGVTMKRKIFLALYGTNIPLGRSRVIEINQLLSEDFRFKSRKKIS
jgi:hypothetical protein